MKKCDALGGSMPHALGYDFPLPEAKEAKGGIVRFFRRHLAMAGAGGA